MSTNAQDKNDGGARRGDEGAGRIVGGNAPREGRPASSPPPASGRPTEPATAPQTTVLGTAGGSGAAAAGTNETTVLDTSGRSAASGTTNETTVLDTTAAGAGAAGAGGSRRQRLSAERQLEEERPSTDTNAYRPASPLDRDSVFVNQREAYGGVKIGSAFFGWLSAAALTVLLFSVVAGAVAAFGFNTGALPQDPRSLATDNSSLGITAIVVSLVLLLIAYFGGGYVAGRMARFDGLRQGLAVWVWGIVMAALAAVIGLATGGLDIIGTVTGSEAVTSMLQDLTVPGLVALGVVLVVTLIGALLGGLTGMRYHRRVDRAGFEPPEEY
ncbi:hypothetical protein D477_012081 [Arthrobacter crystallopoietes BAB-32]|uniref:Uncharacterized protein n=1 Tax=Arthrobacter crystallopoietes BAB-32 TaxID=1246476 RepID=N1UY37_9MICC|nr:YrzE family protein [Arthrobacter crystallopoietes]EMY33980.1 hypothetical protein D477_012081 [Arthrobacter crystallopoietes BAB-32]